MKKYLTNLTLFTLNIIIVLGLLYLSTKSVSYKLSESINTVVLGDSRISRGLNDSLLQNTINLGAGGDSYLISYIKLCKMAESNPQLKNVILGFHDKSLSAYHETWYDIDWQNKISRYWFVDASELIDHYKLLPFLKRVISYGTVQELYKYLWAKSLNHSPFGGYRHLVRDKLDLDLELHSKPLEYFPPDSAKNQLTYLEKILKYCDQNQLNIILLTPPLFVNSPAYTTNHHRYYQMYLKETCYLDYASYALPRDFYGDIDHLNFKGANEFSSILAHDLNSSFNWNTCSGYHVY
jgi:hypothetical protein